MFKNKRIHFSGIAGSGMSALALFASDNGAFVSGSDRTFDMDGSQGLLTLMKKRGIIITAQDGSGIVNGLNTVVFSTAVEETNPEYKRAVSMGIPIKYRPGLLADIIRHYNTIAVAGTSGKSTVSGMLAYLMKGLGLDPNFIGGGRVRQFKTDMNPGNYLTGRSNYLVVEACESDGSIVNYLPTSTILLSLDLDHHQVEETLEMFKKLVANTSKTVFVNGDDKNLRPLLSERTTTFALEGSSKFKPDSVSYSSLHTDFRLQGVDFHLSLPGRYNLLNALACIAYLSSEGVALMDIAHLLPGFTGIERRFQIYLNDLRGMVIDDYAHNPHKIASMMEATQRLRDHICYVFQPHGYGPTRLMKDGYIRTFVTALRDTDHLVLLPIYYAGGTTQRDISSGEIAEQVKKAGRSAEAIDSRDEIFRQIGRFNNFVVFGARDDSLAALAEGIAQRLKGSVTAT